MLYHCSPPLLHTPTLCTHTPTAAIRASVPTPSSRSRLHATTLPTETHCPLSCIAAHVILHLLMHTCHFLFLTCPSTAPHNALVPTSHRLTIPTCPLPAKMCTAMLHRRATASLHTSASCIHSSTAAVHAPLPAPSSHFRLRDTTQPTATLCPLSSVATHFMLLRFMRTCHFPLPTCLPIA